jgi:hypothetical protein
MLWVFNFLTPEGKCNNTLWGSRKIDHNYVEVYGPIIKFRIEFSPVRKSPLCVLLWATCPNLSRGSKHSCFLTNLLHAAFEKPVVVQPPEKFAIFHRTVFIRAGHWSLSSPHLHPNSLRFILILSSDLYLSSKRHLFFSYINTVVCLPLLSHACYTPSSAHPPWLDHSYNLWWWVRLMKFLVK